MNLTFLGHSCFLIENEGVRIILDPFISGNELATEIKVDDLEVDYVLLSHGHEDHVLDAAAIANKNDATLVANFEIATWFQSEKGVKNIHPMNHGGTKIFSFGSVKMVNAIHSSVLPDGTYGGNPSGFIIRIGEQVIYYAGDTALMMDMKLIGEYEKPTIGILPIGDNFTMGYEDAVIAADFIQCDNIIGMHFDTFPYIKTDLEKAKQAFQEKSKTLRVLRIGETIEL